MATNTAKATASSHMTRSQRSRRICPIGWLIDLLKLRWHPAERVDLDNPAMENLDLLLTTQQLAAYLDVPVATLYAWRYAGEGPPGFRVGKHLRYRSSDIDQWIRHQLDTTQRRTG